MFMDIKLRFQPTEPFVGILAELNEQYSQWTDGSYDWADQKVDFLHNQEKLPQFSEALYTTPFSFKLAPSPMNIVHPNSQRTEPP